MGNFLCLFISRSRSAKASIGWMDGRQDRTEIALEFQSAEIEMIGC